MKRGEMNKNVVNKNSFWNSAICRVITVTSIHERTRRINTSVQIYFLKLMDTMSTYPRRVFRHTLHKIENHFKTIILKTRAL